MTSPITTSKHHRLTARTMDLVLVMTILTQALIGRVVARAKEGMESGDRGEVLAWVVLAAGGALLAYYVLGRVRGKGDTIVDNVCTTADPTTC